MAQKQEDKKYPKRYSSENDLIMEKIKNDIDDRLATKLDTLKETVLTEIKAVIDKSLDDIYSHFNGRIENVEQKIENMIKKTENESREVTKKLNKCMKDNEELKKKLESKSTQMIEIEERLEERTNRQLRKTLIFKNIPESDNEKWEKTQRTISLMLSLTYLMGI